ncbi:glycosyltransferase [Rhodoferax sp. GW822-FHT02A01]|uniref:glycosyltransferase n=1 Tax=Rhodoferax sp. GW822-FHT02A01 TaxID=3141537 RepID=UPI00315DDC46
MSKSLAEKWTRRKEKFRRSWDKVVFNAFLHPQTAAQHKEILRTAELALAHKSEHESAEICLQSSSLITRQGWTLKVETELKYRESLKSITDERILIHVPDPMHSPAGYSLFTNLAQSLSFIGVPTRTLGWEEPLAEVFAQFSPSVFLTSDHIEYLSRINWKAVSDYKQQARLRVGLTASLEEYGNTPLMGRLEWAQRNEVDFFYSFRDDDYVNRRAEYVPFKAQGFKIVFIPFGANILHYYPVEGFQRDLDFVLIATRKSEHASYLRSISSQYHGFIDGPGWRHAPGFSFNRARDRYIYARAKVGLNVHLPEQIQWPCELNERTYQLAACGVPQLIDHPLLLDKLFSRNAFFVADSVSQYKKMFREIMADPQQAEQRALLAQREAFQFHNTFLRAERFVQQLGGL